MGFLFPFSRTMKKFPLKSALLVLFGLFLSPLLPAQNNIYVLNLRGDINASSAHYMTKGIDAAENAKADWIIVHMDTYGGQVDFADSIRSKLLRTNIPSVVFVDRNAASAGALISLACDSIYMAPGSSIGAATVVTETHEAAPDKYQSYFRGIMRATASHNGRNPAIAEKMVDQNLQLDSISPKGQVITFSPEEAIKYGYCEGIKNSLQEVAEAIGITNPKFTEYQSDTVDTIIEFLVNPTVASILMLIIFWGIILEVKMPGFGVPGIAAILAIFLFFAPHYIHGVANQWEILLFLLGLVLIALEVFVIPGFGAAGVLGIIFVFAGLIGAMVPNNGFDFSHVEKNDILLSSSIVLGGLAVSIFLAVIAAKYFLTAKRAHPLVDDDTQQASEGYVAVRHMLMQMVGKEGIAVTDLKPSGFIEVEGNRIDAEAEGGFIPRDSRVRVMLLKTNILSVRKI